MSKGISAILLAAGESRRMGQPKLLLPWGDTTVLGQVVATFAATGLENILVVTGGAGKQVEELVTQLANRVRAGRRKYFERSGHTGRISPSATLDP